MPPVNTAKDNQGKLECCLFFVMDEILWDIKDPALVKDGTPHLVCTIIFCYLYYTTHGPILLLVRFNPNRALFFGGKRVHASQIPTVLGVSVKFFLAGLLSCNTEIPIYFYHYSQQTSHSHILLNGTLHLSPQICNWNYQHTIFILRLLVTYPLGFRPRWCRIASIFTGFPSSFSVIIWALETGRSVRLSSGIAIIW